MWSRRDESAVERNLRYELERAEDELRRIREQEDQARSERRREREEQVAESYRAAKTWHEALVKQASLFTSEAAHFPCDDDGNIPGENYNRENDFFAQGADACNRALELWGLADSTRRDRRWKVQAEMDALELEIRSEVADKLDAEKQNSGWRQVCRRPPRSR